MFIKIISRKAECLPFLLCSFLSFSLKAQSPRPIPVSYTSSAAKSYIRTLEANVPVTDPNVMISKATLDARQVTSYVDGLGRILQTVLKDGSFSTSTQIKKDMVSSVEYDSYGREQYRYVPFASTTNDGNFKLDPFQQQQTFMSQQFGSQNEVFFYGQTVFEASPMNRASKVMAPGNSWTGNSVGVSSGFWLNTANDDVRVWNVTDVQNGWGTYTQGGSVYLAGSLTKNISTDENNRQVIEFVDLEGKVILKKVQLTAASDAGTGSGYTGWLSTYYIYDNVGNLRCVIQPKGVETLTQNGWSITQSLLDEQCFRYEYDERNRMVMKKVPGAGEVWMVYDARDRLVLSQDANLRTQGKWMYNLYDEVNRPISSGLWTNSQDRLTHKASAYNSIAYPNLSGQTYEELSNTFYNDYSWLATYSNPMNSNYDASYDGYFQSASNSIWPYPQASSKTIQLKGVVTGTRTKVLGTANTYLYQETLYDQKVRAIQVQSTNQTGGTDVLTTQYCWSGKPLVNIQKQAKSGTNSQSFISVTQITYDDLFRLLKLEKKVQHSLVNGNAMPAYKTIVQNEYDELGQLKKKTLAPTGGPGGGILETLIFDFNIRGWMLGMNRDYARDVNSSNYFGFDLGYDKTANNLVGGQSYNAAQLNGNISGMVWKSKGDGEKRKYDFNYDAANRLMKADFTQYTGGSFNTTAGINFSMKMGDGVTESTAYDANGNIQQMQQWGLKTGATAQIDNLSYVYQNGSNKLAKVTDANNDPNTKLGDFKDGSNGASDDYSYDTNGNLNQDLNKAISSITYNHLNLPSVISVTGKGTITYTYDAAGNKLTKTVNETGQPVKITQYMGGAVYQNDTLQFLSHEEGRIRFKPVSGATPASLQCDYMLKDHLGNVRVLLTEEQQTDAYPAATMETAQSTNENIYYSNINTTRSAKPSGYPVDNYTSPNDYAAKVNGSGNKIGPAIILKVMAGDKFNLRVNSWYKLNGSTPSAPNPLTELAAALASGVAGVSSGKISAADMTNAGLAGDVATNFLGSQIYTISKPKAYVNWILLDEQFKAAKDGSGNIVSGGYSGFEQVGNDQEFKTHLFSNMPINKSGYLYIYVSNETPNIDVFFDNLQVTQIRGPLLEETHYYPFGLTMAGISSKALNGAVENKKKFNGIEHNTDFDLNMYDAFYRNLDPQIGRFWQVDPKLESTEAWSPYAAMLDNPIKYADPLGDTVVLPNASEKFQKQFTEATSLLIAKGAGDLYIQAVESKGTIKVVETTDENSSYDPKTKTISWNPTVGIAAENGDMSATAVFNHEMDHAVQHDKNPKQFKKNSDTPDKQYSDKEEKRVIKGSEQKTAQALGEMPKGIPTRTNHKGQAYPTSGPTSTKSLIQEKLEEQMKNKKEN